MKELCPLCREKKDWVRGQEGYEKARGLGLNKTTAKKHGPVAVYGETDQKFSLSFKPRLE